MDSFTKKVPIVILSILIRSDTRLEAAVFFAKV